MSGENPKRKDDRGGLQLRTTLSNRPSCTITVYDRSNKRYMNWCKKLRGVKREHIE